MVLNIKNISIKLDSFFRIKEKESTISIEILAGLSTFLSLSYIFVVNPAILSEAGMDKTAVLFATILTSALATFFMGLWAKLPFVLSTGMEMNGYVAFFAVGTMGFTWQESLGAVFWSGIIFLILTLSKIREKIIDSIPNKMKSSISLSVGIFLILISLKISGVLNYNGINLVGLGSIFNVQFFVLLFSLFIILILEKFRIRGSVLISIVLSAIFYHIFVIANVSPEKVLISNRMFNSISKLDYLVIFNPKIFSIILVLFLVDFYGSLAKLIGLTQNTNIRQNGKVPNMKEALFIDSSSTLLGSILGTTSMTIYVESGVGINAGGRTGLTAITCSVLMILTFFISPYLHYIPVVATTGALFFVGLKLIPSYKYLKSYSKIDVATMVLMQLIVVITFALDKAMLAGFVVYIINALISKEKFNFFLILSTLLLLVGLILQLI